MSTETQTVKKQNTLKEWTQEIAECQSSGMTVSEWCKLHGINVKTYYNHLRKVRETAFTENRVVPLGTKSITNNIENYIRSVHYILIDKRIYDFSPILNFKIFLFGRFLYS